MTVQSGQVTQEQLRTIVERIENLEKERASVSDTIRGVYLEAKGNGYDAKTLRKIVALRRKSSDERYEEEYMLSVYKNALGLAIALEDITIAKDPQQHLIGA